MTGNDDFDLPRWQTQTSHEAGATYYSPPPPPPTLTSHRIPQQSPGSSRQPRITQIVEEDNQFGVNPVLYNAGPLSRSNSMGGSTASTRRRHHLPDELEGPGPASLYPTSVPFQSQTNSDAINAAPASGSPYQEMYYNSSPTHPPKRSQTQHDSSTSSRSGRSPMRHGNLSTPSLLDTYATQQSQYSPTSAPGFSYPDQQRPYGSSAYKSHSRSNSNTNPLAGSDNPPPYPAQYGGSSQSPNTPPAASPAHLTTQRSVRQNSSSVPSTPLSFTQANPLQEGATHYYPQEAQPMVVDASKRRTIGFHRVRDHNDLRPVLNRVPTGRRMDSQGLYLAVLEFLRCIFFYF
jgi:dual specificity protein kinase YAK1